MTDPLEDLWNSVSISHISFLVFYFLYNVQPIQSLRLIIENHIEKIYCISIMTDRDLAKTGSVVSVISLNRNLSTPQLTKRFVQTKYCTCNLLATSCCVTFSESSYQLLNLYNYRVLTVTWLFWMWENSETKQYLMLEGSL